MSIETVTVETWPPPKGYINGAIGVGRPLHVAGQIGWQPDGRFTEESLVGQFGVALDNVLAVVSAAGGSASDVARLTVYVTDLPAYRASLRELGTVWRARFGKHFPAMALVGVTGLVETKALVEIEATAYIADKIAR